MAIKNCPFCGAEGTLWRNWGRGKWFVMVKCTVCKSSGKVFVNDSKADLDDDEWWEDDSCEYAIKAWNRRS